MQYSFISHFIYLLHFINIIIFQWDIELVFVFPFSQKKKGKFLSMKPFALCFTVVHCDDICACFLET